MKKPKVLQTFGNRKKLSTKEITDILSQITNVPKKRNTIWKSGTDPDLRFRCLDPAAIVCFYPHL